MPRSPEALTERLFPAELVGLAQGLKGPFLESYGAAPLLCVSVAPGSELELGLSSSAPAVSAGRSLEFRTAASSGLPSEEVGWLTWSVRALRARLLAGRHFGVPLIKRQLDSVSMDRITVGRARNNDVVLRDASVSKLHAWFEIGPRGICVADAGSKNGTIAGSDPLPARELVEVAYGEPLCFGDVRGFLCSADVLWDAFHLDVEE